MPETEYRLFFNNNAASQELLETISEVTVEQEVDMAWEARLQIAVTVDARGNWQGGDEDYMRPFSRLPRCLGETLDCSQTPQLLSSVQLVPSRPNSWLRQRH